MSFTLFGKASKKYERIKKTNFSSNLKEIAKAMDNWIIIDKDNKKRIVDPRELFPTSMLDTTELSPDDGEIIFPDSPDFPDFKKREVNLNEKKKRKAKARKKRAKI